MQSVLPRIKRSYPAPKGFAAATASDTYDGTDDRGRRRAPRTQTSAEDSHANERRRVILSATTRDLARNFLIAAWAIRKHLDFISDFSFQAKTPDVGYNAYLQSWWESVTTKKRFDAAGRHNHRHALRLAEACKTIDGDVGWLKVAPAAADNPYRGTVQAIEGDRIAMPTGDIPSNSKPEEWINGVRVNPFSGAALAYGICRRVGATRKELQRIVPARNMMMHAAYEFRYDQVRGISPIAAALNWFQDTYEGFEYALAKMKVAQLFGLTIKTSDAAGALPPDPNDIDGDGETDTAESEARDEIPLTKGPFVTELDPGEEASVVESKNPSTETVNFLKLMIHVALRALDIPYSFWDDAASTFYGSRGGLIQYLHSCYPKVCALQEFQDEHFSWRAGLAVEDGELELPSGKDFDFLKWEFVAGGIEWWDRTKESRGAAMSIAAGLTSPQRVCREIGTNFERNIIETKEAMDFAKSHDVPLVFADSSAFAPSVTVGGGVDE